MSKFVHRVILETTNCTVLCCSRRKSKAGWKYKEKYNRKNGEKHVAYVKK